MSIKARFYVSSIRKTVHPFVSVELLPVTRATDDNVDWSKFTPSGKIELSVSTATGAAKAFEDAIGKDIAVTFEVIEPTE